MANQLGLTLWWENNNNKGCRSILLYMLLQQTVVKPAPVAGEVAAATVTQVQQSVGYGVVF